MNVWNKIFEYFAGSQTATTIFEKIDKSDRIWSAVWTKCDYSYFDDINHTIYLRRLCDKKEQIANIANELGHILDYEKNPSDYEARRQVNGIYKDYQKRTGEDPKWLIEWPAIETEHKILDELNIPWLKK